jgi:Cu-processing system ATP-binding protein
VTVIVEVQRATKRYGTIEAVRGVSLALNPGETVALVGHNGAGKTTLFKLMLGLARPSAGTIRVLGEDPAAGEFAARRRLGYLPESVSFNAALTGREVLSFYARLKDEPVAKTLELLDRVGLASASARRIGTYSKGMRQRLGLAQALIGEPKLLLLDEPTTGLDPALRLEFYEIVQELRNRGATVVLSSHALTELEERTERVVIMNQGIIVANGSLDELRRIAGLPTKIRLTVARGQADRLSTLVGPVANWREVNGHVVEFDARPDEKIELIRRATGAGSPTEDVAVIPPTLDDLYVHFLGTREAAG